MDAQITGYVSDGAAGIGNHPGTAIEQLIGVFPLSWHGLGVPFFQVGILVSGPPSNLAWLNAYRAVRKEVLDRYLDESIKAYRPPRFFLNDVVRYWRTICVDFAGKEHEGPEKWGLRNAKLRTSRKILFAGGLLPSLECFRIDLPQIRDFLEAQLDMLPSDRIAECFLVHNAIEPGAQTFAAYDEFVGRMDDPEFRGELAKVMRDNCGDSAAFADVQRLGHELQDGLLALLYETRQLPQVVRDYAIF